MKSNTKTALLLLVPLAVLLLGGGALAQSAPAEEATTSESTNDASSPTESPISESRLARLSQPGPVVVDEDRLVVRESVKAFIDKGKPISHVILGLLVVAIVLMVDQLRQHLLERLRGTKIYKTDLGEVSVKEFEEIADQGKKSSVGRFLSDAVGVYKQSGDLSMVSAESEFYREKAEHRFNTFEARMAFLADTAGGLGLLGTVWGIYRGFAAKAVAQSNEDLLAAMGVALVTTFLGIVVSVIINRMSTEMGAAVRNRIMSAMTKIENYREILIKDIHDRAA